MKLTVRCRSGLRIDFEGSLEELERFDGFLAELARPAAGTIRRPCPRPACPGGDRHRRARARMDAEHGPVSYSWVADQLVKNRRDTAALMRDMTLAGELAETDEGGYYDVPDRDDQAQARSLAHRSLVAATPDSPARRCPTCEGNRQEFRGLRDELARVKAAASPDERLREALALVYVMLTGAEPMWAEMPLDERCARAANEAQQAFLAADREAPNEPKETTT